MSIASAQYDDDEILAMTRAAAALVVRWGVQDEAAERLLNGEGGCSAARHSSRIAMHVR
jgi:hypothetical protein